MERAVNEKGSGSRGAYPGRIETLCLGLRVTSTLAKKTGGLGSLIIQRAAENAILRPASSETLLKFTAPLKRCPDTNRAFFSSRLDSNGAFGDGLPDGISERTIGIR